MSKRFKIDFKNLNFVKVFYGVILIGAFVIIMLLSFRGSPEVPITNILIESDEDFAKYDLAGEGTALNPYIIEGLTLDTGVDKGIVIKNTSKYFNISGCNISNTNVVGILLENVTQGTGIIQGNIFINTTVAIRIIETTNCTINNNQFSLGRDYSIVLSTTATDISVYSNDFIDNNVGGGTQAIDNGNSNSWYNIVTTSGNFWSDLGTNSTYIIDGTAGSIDLHPLANPIF
ncbi:MAG: right-handed parallel beta-helix repeat-containing protein [Candidatus Heimdallarchaeota archaeon]|nr:hypothetical protein [Candidatus Heimdallarchaeota archaeon]MCG3255781.1 right-handed parallel beta-helix repeat-containing protein [Candidatus Heimdallarchaeota archaeon]MCK4610855.1 right-handed parallel beta-helix repeat-containing protein [Candidatus Heimdallarchaeota archaeon]